MGLAEEFQYRFEKLTDYLPVRNRERTVEAFEKVMAEAKAAERATMIFSAESHTGTVPVALGEVVLAVTR